jgi:predicted LPLAT superfamily acyltransferase
MEYRICALIVTYNHFQVLEKIINKLNNHKLQIFIVDDGSNISTKLALSKIYIKYPHIIHTELQNNSGKGAAIAVGLKQIVIHKYTHVLQIDADGQHSLSRLQDFLDLSRANPGALVSGHPVYDKSISLLRRIGRWFTHVWVWIETLSFRITDSMCGMRIYPLAKTLEIMVKYNVGKRMDFDTDIMVRLFWCGVPVIMSPVDVTYPIDNISNFKIFQDNWRICKMHTRLFFTMLSKFYTIVSRRPDYTTLNLNSKIIHWSSLNERGSMIGVLFLVMLYKLVGKRICLTISYLLIIYFYIFSNTQRHSSKKFLQKVFLCGGKIDNPNHISCLRHFNNFFNMMVDKIAAWYGDISIDHFNPVSVAILKGIMDNKQGGMFLVSHLGNIELCRAVINKQQGKNLHVLLHSKNSLNFHSALNKINPAYNLNIIEVTEIGLDTILWLKHCIQQGDWVAIAADRIGVQNNDRTSKVMFLGAEANFPQGPYILASLLECQVYAITAVHDKNQYRIDVSLLFDLVKFDRSCREQQLQYCAQKYASYLERYCLEYPYQWYNFFDFWEEGIR